MNTSEIMRMLNGVIGWIGQLEETADKRHRRIAGRLESLEQRLEALECGLVVGCDPRVLPSQSEISELKESR